MVGFNLLVCKDIENVSVMNNKSCIQVDKSCILTAKTCIESSNSRHVCIHIQKKKNTE